MLMVKLLKRIIVSQKGQALPVVLALLVVGGLTISPVLHHAAAGLISSRTIAKGVKGVYAAEAGVEYALWCNKHSVPVPAQLPETANQLQVSIQSHDKGIYTVRFGELVQTEEHSIWLDVDGIMEWDNGAGKYRYTITVTWQPVPGTPVIHLGEVGVRLPVGYSYEPWSALLFDDNLSTVEPDRGEDFNGAQMLKWTFSSPYPYVSKAEQMRRQAFYLNGSGELGGDYTWGVAIRSDVGVVGEITGNLYLITSTARTQSGEVTAEITADVLEADRTYVITWSISK